MYTSNVNEVKIIGYSPNKPVLRTARNGNPYCVTNIATHRTYVDRHGEIHEKTEWLPVRFWAGLAIEANKSMDKGSEVSIKGRIVTFSMMKDGRRIYKVEVEATELKLVDKEEYSAWVIKKPEHDCI